MHGYCFPGNRVAFASLAVPVNACKLIPNRCRRRFLFSSGNFLEPSKPATSKRPTPVPTKPSSRRKNRPRRPIAQATTSTARYEEYSVANRGGSKTPTTTTPAPPTTPDSGTDFKCEDEGFFSHPRDCKKYFWCLDSGPSQLGIVAHQFTCPSGLVFNKLADSCDYTRNVQCTKSKASTTTAKSTTTSTSTTSAPPPRTTSSSGTAPKRNFASIRPLLRTKPTTTTTTSTTSTTTEAYLEEEYDDEEYDEEAGTDDDGTDASQAALDSEDPKVIKELIDLIKKVGGIEELEKQLKQNQDGSHALYDPNQWSVTTTPSSITKKLYEKILRKPIPGVASGAVKDIAVAEVLRPVAAESTTVASYSSGQLPKYSSIYRATNSRPGPQNDGLDKFAETEGLRNEKPQYITITRNRPQTNVAPVHEDPNEAEAEEEDGDASSEDISIARSTESTFVRYTIPEHVEVTGHDDTYRLSSGFDGHTQPSPSTPYVTIYRTTTPVPSKSGGGDHAQPATSM